MADVPVPQPKIETPPGVTTASAEPQIFAMPEAYRGGATGKLVEPKKEVVAPAVKPVAPPPPPAAKPAVPKKKRKTGLFIVIGLIFIAGLGIGGYLLLQVPAPSTQPTSTPTPRPVPRPTPTPTPPPEPEPVPTPEPFPKPATPGVDSDSDGLTDLEERVLYNTDPRLPDMDGDGFLDGNEVFHRYNPAGTAPGTLLESGLVKAFTRETLPTFALLYPSVWAVRTETDGQVVFTATTGETVTVSLSPRRPGQSLSDWYAAQGLTERTTAMMTKNGYAALVSENQLKTFIDFAPDAVVTLSYDTGIKGTVDYLQTFKMMMNSLAVTL